jgi:hypothetical protein
MGLVEEWLSSLIKENTRRHHKIAAIIMPTPNPAIKEVTILVLV